MTKDLTEQWKNGELKEGWYYITNKAHSIKFNQMALYIVHGEIKYWTECKDEDIEEVLAPVPSWEKYERILVENDSLIQIRDELDCAVTQLREDKIDLIEENNKLKELLKECKHIIKWYKADYKDADVLNEDVITKIDEVLK